MSKLKELSIEVIKKLPDDVTIEDIVDAILIVAKAQQGIEQINNGSFLTHEQLKEELKKEIEESEKDIENGRAHNARLVFKEMEEKYND